MTAVTYAQRTLARTSQFDRIVGPETVKGAKLETYDMVFAPAIDEQLVELIQRAIETFDDGPFSSTYEEVASLKVFVAAGASPLNIKNTLADIALKTEVAYAIALEAEEQHQRELELVTA